MNYRHKNLNDALKRVIERVADNIKTQQTRSQMIGRGRLTRIGRLSRAEFERLQQENNEIERDEIEE